MHARCTLLIMAEGEIPAEQLQTCGKVGARPFDTPLDLIAGLGHRLDQMPINGLRHVPRDGTSGWYIWSGGEIDETDGSFFRPTHLTHIVEALPQVARYLALPPGWRFLVAPEQEDIWYDPTIRDTTG